jgi:hypothetical protein
VAQGVSRLDEDEQALIMITDEVLGGWDLLKKWRQSSILTDFSSSFDTPTIARQGHESSARGLHQHMQCLHEANILFRVQAVDKRG